MISLYPDSGPVNPVVDVTAERRHHADGRPWVYSNMVASIDGATALDDVSGGLSSPADRLQFVALRSVADAIIVGGSTVRSERYRPPQLTEEIRAARLKRGQSELPLLVVVSSSLSFDHDIPLFADDNYRPLVATSRSAPTGGLKALEHQADVLVSGNDQVDLKELATQLGVHGNKTILSEGGPTLNGLLIEDNLIDEWNLSISPLLLGGTSTRPAIGPTVVTAPTEMTLVRLWQGDDMLFGRWIRNDGVHESTDRSSGSTIS